MGIDQTMSDFDQLQYQVKTGQLLAHIIQTKKIPNALLFSGDSNTGKKKAAFLFAKGANCLNNKDTGCDQCDSCRKIDGTSHPDILSLDLDSDKKAISISQIRQMAQTIQTRPNEARFRMVLILNSDTMNVQAQNALLKLLEEPPQRTFFILTATQDSRLLPTIHSRCQKIKFQPLSDAFIKDFLKQHGDLDETLCHIFSKTAGSDLQKAIRYAGMDKENCNINWIKKRAWILNTLADIMRSRPEKSINRGLMLSEHLCRTPDTIDECMAIIRTFLRDLMICKLTPKKIVNLDFLATFADINQMVTDTVFSQWLSEWAQTEKRINSNSTIRLTLDRFFLKIATHKGR